jgi:hypothetical protein
MVATGPVAEVASAVFVLVVPTMTTGKLLLSLAGTTFVNVMVFLASHPQAIIAVAAAKKWTTDDLLVGETENGSVRRT